MWSTRGLSVLYWFLCPYPGTTFSHSSLYSSESWNLVCKFSSFALHQGCLAILSQLHLHTHFGIGLLVSLETLPDVDSMCLGSINQFGEHGDLHRHGGPSH